eukprot:8829394-Prorocentrum_lima.AAC.1
MCGFICIIVEGKTQAACQALFELVLARHFLDNVWLHLHHCGGEGSGKLSNFVGIGVSGSCKLPNFV